MDKSKEFTKLSSRDASMYFHGCYAFPKDPEDKRVAFLRILEAGEARDMTSNSKFSKTRYAVACEIKKGGGKEKSKIYTAEEFFDEWDVARTVLGWRNVKSTAVYLHCNPGRGTRKGYQRDSIVTFCPYLEDLAQSIVHYDMERKNKIEAIITRGGRVPDELWSPENSPATAISEVLSSFNLDSNVAITGEARVPVSMFSEQLDPVRAEFFTLEQAINKLCSKGGTPSRSGVAMHTSIAACITAGSPKGCASVYFHDQEVGILNEHGIELQEPSLEPQFVRHLGELR